jgi:hypothetical protein
MNRNEPPRLVAIQGWKLWVYGLLIVLSALCLLMPNASSRVLGVDDLPVQIVAALALIVVFVVIARSSRCPRCRSNLLLYAMTNEHAGMWLHWLLKVATCPKCGYQKGGLHPSGGDI